MNLYFHLSSNWMRNERLQFDIINTRQTRRNEQQAISHSWRDWNSRWAIITKTFQSCNRNIHIMNEQQTYNITEFRACSKLKQISYFELLTIHRAKGKSKCLIFYLIEIDGNVCVACCLLACFILIQMFIRMLVLFLDSLRSTLCHNCGSVKEKKTEEDEERGSEST